MDLKRYRAPFEIKDVTESGSFIGLGSVYGNIDSDNEIIAPGCFAESVAKAMASGEMPPVLWQHRSGEPVGIYQKLIDHPTGLEVHGKLAEKVQRAIEARELMQMKAVKGLSVGFMSRGDSIDRATGIRTITKGDLWECSIVTFPANAEARISAVKSVEDLNSLASVERYLRDAGGFSRSEASALVARMKSFAQSDSEGDIETLAAGLRKRAALLLGQA